MSERPSKTWGKRAFLILLSPLALVFAFPLGLWHIIIIELEDMWRYPDDWSWK